LLANSPGETIGVGRGDTISSFGLNFKEIALKKGLVSHAWREPSVPGAWYYRRREAIDRKRGRGRPAAHATIKKTENAEAD
jgi:hypothetical protein